MYIIVGDVLIFFFILLKLKNLEYVVSVFWENVSFNFIVKYDFFYKNRI